MTLLRPYLGIIDKFLDGSIQAEEISRIYQRFFLTTPVIFGAESPAFAALNAFFLDCEEYVENPALRGPDDLDEAELRSRALQAQARLGALIEGAS